MAVVGPWILIKVISFPLEYMWLTETSNVLVTSSSSGRSPVKWIKQCFVRYPDHPTCMKGRKRNDRSRAKLTLCLSPFLPLSVRGVSSSKSLSFLSQFSICFSAHLIWHSSVQSLSHIWLYNPMDCSTPGLPVHHQLPEHAQTHVYRPGDAIQPSHPLSFPSPSAFNISQHQGLCQWVSSSHQVAKGLEFSFSISPPNEYSGLISFRIDWFDLLVVQGTLKSLPKFKSINSLVLSFLYSPILTSITWLLEKQ